MYVCTGVYFVHVCVDEYEDGWMMIQTAVVAARHRSVRLSPPVLRMTHHCCFLGNHLASHSMHACIQVYILPVLLSPWI